MDLGQVHDHMERRLRNLLTLRGTLSEIIAWELARSDLGCGWSYEACLDWFNKATIDRDYIAVSISTWRNHWLANYCRAGTIRNSD